MRWFIAVFVQTREINEQLNMIYNIETHGIMFFVLFFSFIVIHISATPSGGGETTEVKISDGSDAYCNGQPTKDPMCLTQKQFKRAEIADAVLGTEPPENTAGIKALIPKTTSSTPCEKEVDEKDEVMEEREEVDMVVNQEVAMTEEVDTKQEHPTKGEEQNSTDTAKAYKVNCDKRSISGLETFTVHVLNASQDLMDFLNSNSSECSLVLFYTSWCQFSAQLAPHFNALPRVFPIMHFLALDASQHSSLSTRFGTVAVPNILLFQGAKPMARFNHTERTLEILTAFITNQTGFDAVVGQMVMDEDHVGPLLGAPVKSIDWLFVFSVLFLSVFSLYAILRTDSIRLLIPGHEHDHQD